MKEAYHRALMAFPDEDVVVGSRFVSADALDAFKDLDDVTPRPGARAVGEERAWGRRLAKRFDCDGELRREDVRRASRTARRASSTTSTPKPESVDRPTRSRCSRASPKDGGALVVYGWTMAEDLVKLGARS